MEHYDYTANHSDWFRRVGYEAWGVGRGFGNVLLRCKGKEVALFKGSTPIPLIDSFARIHYGKPEVLESPSHLFGSANPTLNLLVKKDSQIKSLLSKLTKGDRATIEKLFGLPRKGGSL